MRFPESTKEQTYSEGNLTSLLVFSLGSFLAGNYRCFIVRFT